MAAHEAFLRDSEADFSGSGKDESGQPRSSDADALAQFPGRGQIILEYHVHRDRQMLIITIKI